MKRALALLACAVMLAGCDNPQGTADRLRKEIAEYKVKSSDELQVKIDQDFLKLQEQVAKLERDGSDKAEGLHDQLVDLKTDYQAAKMAKTIQDAKSALQGFGDVLKEGAKSIEKAFKSTNDSTNN